MGLCTRKVNTRMPFDNMVIAPCDFDKIFAVIINSRQQIGDKGIEIAGFPYCDGKAMVNIAFHEIEVFNRTGKEQRIGKRDSFTGVVVLTVMEVNLLDFCSHQIVINDLTQLCPTSIQSPIWNERELAR